MLLSGASEPTCPAHLARGDARARLMKRACVILAAFKTAHHRAQTAQSPNASPAARHAAFHQASAVLEDAAAWGWRWDAEGVRGLCASGRYADFLSASAQQFGAFVARAGNRQFECMADECGRTTVHTLAELEANLFETVPRSAVRQRCATLLLSRLVAADVGDIVFHEDPFHGPEHYRRLH